MRKVGSILVALVLAVSTMAAVLPGGSDAMTVQVEFERTFNLFPQSPVRVRGVEVGIITDLITKPGSKVVTVTMRLEGDTSLPDDVNGVIITSALLGERYIQLTGGTAGGDRLADGDVIPVERTVVPFEFDEVLEGLNDFVGGLDENEVARLITNLANLLEGNGEQLGSTIDAAAGAIAALKQNDEELLELASAVADLNTSLSRRDQQLIALMEDFIRVSGTLTSESTDIDGALDGLVTLTREIAQLLIDNRASLSADIDSLTRVGRTASRNLEQISVAILGSAELFRHAERIIDRDTNMLPLVNHGGELEGLILDSLADRLGHLCESSGTEPENCDIGPILDGIIGDGTLCIPGLIRCESPDSVTLADAISGAARAEPAIADGMIAFHNGDNSDADDPDASSGQDRSINDALAKFRLGNDSEGQS